MSKYAENSPLPRLLSRACVVALSGALAVGLASGTAGSALAAPSSGSDDSSSQVIESAMSGPQSEDVAESGDTSRESENELQSGGVQNSEDVDARESGSPTPFEKSADATGGRTPNSQTGTSEQPASVLSRVAPLSSQLLAESEPNGTMTQANVLPMGETLSGSSLAGSFEDVDFFSIDVPSSGRVTFSFEFPKNLGTGRAYVFTVLDASGKKVYDFDLSLAEADGKWLSDQNLSLDVGRYYVKIYGYESYATWGQVYSLSFSTGSPFVASPVPRVVGTVKVGATVSAGVGTWSPTPATLKYRWFRDGKALAGASGKSYKIVSADQGHKLSVSVTASKAGYSTTVKMSTGHQVK